MSSTSQPDTQQPLGAHLPGPFEVTALLLAGTALITIMLFGLLPGLIAGLAAFALTRWLRTLLPGPGTKLAPYAGAFAATTVVAAPLIVLAFAGVELSKFLALAAQNYSSLVAHIVEVAMEWRQRLPEGVRSLLPSSPEEIQATLKGSLQRQVPTLAGVGKTWAAGLVFVVVGVIVGALVAVSDAGDRQKSAPLAKEIRRRAAALSKSFTTIVVAQFWIASINAVLTAAFLFIALPYLADTRIPYSGWLVLLTFVAGMLPIVGNLLCNVVLTLAGLGVGPHIAMVCLLFLIAVHKLEYFINAKVIGSSIKTAAWELIVAMFVFEALFGVAGLVAAPLYYAYLKTELQRLRWV